MTSVRAVGILGAQTAIGRVFIHHRVHTTRSDAEEETRSPQLLEIAEVAVPVGLWHDSHPIAGIFQYASDDGSPERRMVNVGIARE